MKRATDISKKVKENELRLAMFIVEHDVPIAVADHLIEVIKTMDPSSEILKKMSCCRTKCTALIKSAIGQYSFDEVIEKIRVSKFSLMIDESTDRTATKHLVMIVRFLTENGVQDAFLALLEVRDASHVGLYKLITNFFLEYQIPYKTNLVGFASDGASVMMGKNHSVMTLLQQDIPGIFIMKCICHSLVLCASHAASKLPQEVEELVRECYCYLKYSCKRLQKFETLQKIMTVPVHKLLKLADTRWLSLKQCIVRVLEQYNVLIQFLTEENNTEANNILQKLRNPFNKMYLQFFEFVLPIIVDRNEEFQCEKPKIYELYGKMKSMFITIVELYVQEDYVSKTPIHALQYRNPEHFLPLHKVYLGPKAHADLMAVKASENQIRHFRTQCLNFLVKLSSQIYLRFPFNSNDVRMLEYISFIDPVNLKEITTIAPLCSFLNITDLSATDQEYRQLRHHFKDNIITDPISFWSKVRTFIKADGNLLYGNVLCIVDRVIIYPHSSAVCERSFNVVTQNKTKTRNRLETDSLSSILQGKGHLHLHNKHCYNFDCSKKLIDLHSVCMYGFKNISG